MSNARAKNIAHDNKQVVRPKTVQYDFTALECAMKTWFNINSK